MDILKQNTLKPAPSLQSSCSKFWNMAGTYGYSETKAAKTRAQPQIFVFQCYVQKLYACLFSCST